jgi:hypothetical protein
MNLIWIFGRFTLLFLAMVAVVSTAGCEQPMMLLRFILAADGGSASTSSQVSAAVRSVGFTTITATDEPFLKDSRPTPKAEDLIKDWEKPEFAIFVSGRQHGYMEPCGCTGLANQKGGLMRRHSAMKVLKERGWDLVPIDSGNQVRRFGQQPILKLGKTYQALCGVLDYDVIGLGPDDLKLPSIDLCQAMLDCPEGEQRFTSANVEVVAPDVSQKFEIIEAGGKKIGVTMVLGDEHLEALKQNDDLAIVSATDGLTKVVPEIQKEKCDLKILVAHASLEECRELAKKFPVFDILITAGGAGDPTLHPEVIDVGGNVTSMIQVGVKGMYVGIIGFYVKDGRASLKYERVPLDERFEDSPEIKEIFFSYQMELKRLWEKGELADIKPRPHPTGYRFVGSAACADCHDEEYEIWEDGVDGKGGPHEKSTRDLTAPGERAWVQRHFDPECVSCHMTGWNPQLYYPYVSGYMNLEKDKHMHANGCENCHGPGSAHIAAEEDDSNQGLIDKLRKEMRLTLAEARANACVQCHDLDNSPDFVKEGGFDEYWPHIEH